MSDTEQGIQELARKLLEERRVTTIIGYERGSLPLRSTPCFVSDPTDIERLIWDPTCGPNLAKYLIGRKDRAGIVGKACDVRALVVCIIEKQISRENVVIIGVPCTGVIDNKKVEERLYSRELKEATIAEGMVTVKEDSTQSIPLQELMAESCTVCNHRNPPTYDFFVGQKVEERPETGEIPEIARLDAMLPAERWEHFSKEFNKCIRCYACRNVCPLCYCKECFVDQTLPTWLGKTDSLSDIMVFHIVRVMHVAGRCVGCGACDRACPMGIELRKLTKRMECLVKDLYDYEAGLDPKEKPPLASFKPDDSQNFVLGGGLK